MAASSDERERERGEGDGGGIALLDLESGAEGEGPSSLSSLFLLEVWLPSSDASLSAWKRVRGVREGGAQGQHHLKAERIDGSRCSGPNLWS
jgi:hypothetical protein